MSRALAAVVKAYQCATSEARYKELRRQNSDMWFLMDACGDDLTDAEYQHWVKEQNDVWRELRKLKTLDCAYMKTPYWL